MSSIILYIGVPGIAKHALIEAIEKALFNDYGVYEHLLGSFVKDTVIDYLDRFFKELLQHSAQFGFWMLTTVMFIGFALSLVGLILEARNGESKSKMKTPVVPKLYGINGEYAGADVLIGGEIKRNLPTELPAGRIIQLGKNGDTFRLGN